MLLTPDSHSGPEDRGAWKWDDEKNVGIGNPCRAHNVQDLMKSLRKKAKSRDAPPTKHATPMTYENLRDLHAATVEVCDPKTPLPEGPTCTAAMFEAKLIRVGSAVPWLLFLR